MNSYNHFVIFFSAAGTAIMRVLCIPCLVPVYICFNRIVADPWKGKIHRVWAPVQKLN